MRIYNVSLPDNVPLLYPLGVVLTPPIPVTRADTRRLNSKFSSLVDPSLINISWLSANQCKVVSDRLGIQEPPALTLAERRDLIHEYMGAPGALGFSVPNWDVALFGQERGLKVPVILAQFIGDASRLMEGGTFILFYFIFFIFGFSSSRSGFV